MTGAMLSGRLSLSPGGKVALRVRDGQARVWSRRALAFDAPCDLALALDDQVWLFTSLGVDLEVARRDLTGDPLGEPHRVAGVGGLLEVAPGAPANAPVVRCHRAVVALRVDMNRLSSITRAPAEAAISGEELVTVRAGTFWLEGSGEPRRLGPVGKGEVTGGFAVGGGVGFALVRQMARSGLDKAGREIQVYRGLRRPALQQVVRVAGLTGVSGSGDSWQVFVARASEVAPVNLLSKRIGPWLALPAPPFAMAAAGRSRAFLADTGGGDAGLFLWAGGELSPLEGARSSPPGTAASARGDAEQEPPAERLEVLPVDAPAELQRTDVAAMDRSLAGLAPRTTALDVSEDAIAPHVALVQALCYLAIASAWRSGRLARPELDAVPFHSEVCAALGGQMSSSQAAAEYERARTRLEGARALFLQALERPDDPARALASELALSPCAVDVLLAVAMPRIWPALDRLYQILANAPERPRCDEWLVTELLEPLWSRRQIAAELELQAPLVSSGLLVAGAGERPFAALAVDPIAVRRLLGESGDRTTSDDLAQVRSTEPGWFVGASGAIAAIAESMSGPAATPLRLIVNARAGTGATTLLAMLVSKAGRRLGLVDLDRLGGTVPLDHRLALALRRARLRGWIPCVVGLEVAGGESEEARRALGQAIEAHPGPVLIRARLDAHLPLSSGHPRVELPLMSEAERAALWRAELAAFAASGEPDGGFDPGVFAPDLARRFAIGPAAIRRAVDAARAAGHTGEGAAAELDRSLRGQQARQLETLARRSRPVVSWNQVILPEGLRDSLLELTSQVRERGLVYEEWGFDRTVTSARGITALFHGAPGTGKTLVAGLIAQELGYDLYRVETPRILSKWIGETEKNLAALFDAAEEGQVVLLFDEADSLFAKRTAVQSSSDRFGNTAVNYLLQRLDSFEGVAILTSNFEKSIDRAFLRRLSMRLSFPFPSDEERERIWRAHIPARVPRRGDLDFAELGRRFRVSGGFIRNSALRAAFLAAREREPLCQAHLERAVALEYADAGHLSTSGTLE